MTTPTGESSVSGEGHDLARFGQAVALEMPDRSVTFALVSRRARQLADGLRRLGIRADHRVGLLCCPGHADDHIVAHLAVQSIGATSMLFEYGDHEAVVEMVRDAAPDWTLACAEGWTTWVESGRPGRVVTDQPLHTWWRAIERSGRATPDEAAGPAATGPSGCRSTTTVTRLAGHPAGHPAARPAPGGGAHHPLGHQDTCLAELAQGRGLRVRLDPGSGRTTVSVGAHQEAS